MRLYINNNFLKLFNTFYFSTSNTFRVHDAWCSNVSSAKAHTIQKILSELWRKLWWDVKMYVGLRASFGFKTLYDRKPRPLQRAGSQAACVQTTLSDIPKLTYNKLN